MNIDIDYIEDRTRVLGELGLFASPEQASAVFAKIREARLFVQNGKHAEAAYVAAGAEATLHTALADKPRRWRAIRYHQLHLYAFHAAVILFVLNIGTGGIWFIAPEIWGIPVAVVGFGVLGAELRAVWFLHRQVARQTFRSPFQLGHICAPWIGVLFGLLVYLLLWAGLLTLQGGDAVNLSESALPFGLAFLAGFSWEWLLARLDSLRAPPEGSGKTAIQSDGDKGTAHQAQSDTGSPAASPPRSRPSPPKRDKVIAGGE